MSRHVAHREPRAHWVLLVLGVLVLLGELCLDGYVAQVGAEGRTAPDTPAGTAQAPAEVRAGGPVLRLDPAGHVQSTALPARTIALTFDDGPDPLWTPRILDVLARHGAHATFFVVGSKVNEHPELARRILAEGHELGVHTFTHVELAATPGWRRRLEVSLTRTAIAGATGRVATLLRPPYSSGPDALTDRDYAALRDVAGQGYLAVLADRDTEDWRRPGVDAIVRAAAPPAETAAGTGAVVMMHDGGGDRAQTVAAVDQLLGRVSGYRFETVSDALALTGPVAASAGVRLRGAALRWAQRLGAWLARAMSILLLFALGLAALRLTVQVYCARWHARRSRHPQPPRYLGLVSVIVPAYNEAANIAATVRSLLDSDYPDLDVIVVDDGSTDATAEIVAALRLPRVRLIRQPNAGKPAALNTGIAVARGRALVLVDGDTVLEPAALGRLIQPFTDPGVGAVSGNTKVANRGGLLGRWQHLEYVIGFNLDRRMFDIAECMPTVPGAIGAFRAGTLRDVGGVPAVTLAEDTDLTMAVLRAGWKVVYRPDAVAWTEVPGSLGQLWRQRYRWCYGTMQAMWRHRRAMIERGTAGRFGRRGLAYLLLFQVLLPLAAPAVDAYAVYGLLFLPWTHVVAAWCGLLLAQALTAGYALRLDRERLGPLWSLPLQQIVYRQVMYLVVIQSTVAALLGGRQRWHRLIRTGEADALLARAGVGTGR